MDKFKLVQRVDFIKEVCAGRKILHLGCTNWPYTQVAIDNDMLLHFELKSIASELYGFDFDQEGINLLSAAGVDNLYQADLESLGDVDLSDTFDVIVAGEIIEHLNNPGLFLSGIKRFMNEETRLVITTINAYGAARGFIYALRGKSGINEPVHPDHVAYYSYRTLKLLIERAGLNLNEFMYYDIGKEHRPFSHRVVNLVNDVCVRFIPHFADGVIAVCTLDVEETT
jgi:SAM-dependent methyltransferase